MEGSCGGPFQILITFVVSAHGCDGQAKASGLGSSRLQVVPTTQLPLSLTNKTTWPISGFQIHTHLVRLTLPLAGALGIHPEVGVHVVGADASVRVSDGRQGQASRGHPKQQQEQRCHLPPAGPGTAAPRGPHGEVCGAQRPPLRWRQGWGPQGLVLLGGCGHLPCPPQRASLPLLGLQLPRLPPPSPWSPPGCAASDEGGPLSGVCGERSCTGARAWIYVLGAPPDWEQANLTPVTGRLPAPLSCG